MRALAALLLLAPLLAGCLEEPDPPAPGGLPTLSSPLPSPELPPPSDLLYRREHVFLAEDASRADGVQVPPGQAALVFEASISAGLLDGPAVSITLRSPEGETAAACERDSCSARVERPLPGTWVVAYAGVAPRNATVTLRLVAEATPVTPVPPTIVTAPTPIPSPTPLPADARATLYRRGYDWSQPVYTALQRDVFVVLTSYDLLRLEAPFGRGDGPLGNSTLRLLDPAGKDVGSCAPPSPCRLEVESPEQGLWRVEYDGTGSVRADVTVSGLSPRGSLPPNATAYRQVHAYPPVYPWNRTEGFWVTEGYPSLLFSMGFRHDGLAREGDAPRVMLLDPDGVVRGHCELGPGLSCPNQVHADPPGLWRLRYLGPATGTAEVNVFLYGGPPGARPTYSTAPAPGEETLHRNKREASGEALVLVPEDASRLRLVVEANGTYKGRVDLVGPDGVAWAICTQPCERVVHLRGGQAGEWRLRYSPEVHDEVGASVYLARR